MAVRQESSPMEPWNDLGGKVVMVTGASSGLGREFCLDLARAGCNIVAAARRTDRLQSLCEEINRLASSSSSSFGTASPRAVAVELDLNADGTIIENSVKKSWDSFGFIDALVNNAGLRGTVKSPLELSEEEWDQVVGTNLKGSWLVSKYVCTHMRDTNRAGSIINISSIGGLNRGLLPGGVAYSASKAGLNTLTKVMAIELGGCNIRVNSVSPGIFKSEITKSLMQKDWLNNVALRIVPLKTHGTSDPALTILVRYLVHDSSRYVSANNLAIVDLLFLQFSTQAIPPFPISSMASVSNHMGIQSLNLISFINGSVHFTNHPSSQPLPPESFNKTTQIHTHHFSYCNSPPLSNILRPRTPFSLAKKLSP